jgi:hypothetical protein
LEAEGNPVRAWDIVSQKRTGYRGHLHFGGFSRIESPYLERAVTLVADDPEVEPENRQRFEARYRQMLGQLQR